MSGIDTDKIKLCDIIVVGGGAAGLFFVANCEIGKCVLLEKSNKTGQKLLLSGSGSCNLTQSGEIKDFISKYGNNGRAIRKTLYSYNNLKVKEYFEKNGLQLHEREDGKIFPSSMKASDVKEVLEKKASRNYVEIILNEDVDEIRVLDEKNNKDNYNFILNNKYKTKKLIIATGGITYPQTGSDGKMMEVLKRMGIKIIEPKEALVPIRIKGYPFEEIEGVAIQRCELTIFDSKTNKKIAKEDGAILFTKKDISGPAALNISRYYKNGDKICIKYGDKSCELDTKGCNQSILNYLVSKLSLPRSLVVVLLKSLNINQSVKASAVAAKSLRCFVEGFTYEMIGTAGKNKAMATSGGVSLDDIYLDSFESKKINNLYFIGEVVDVDGNTGGYNLQFAFSSAISALKSLKIE